MPTPNFVKFEDVYSDKDSRKWFVRFVVNEGSVFNSPYLWSNSGEAWEAGKRAIEIWETTGVLPDLSQKW